MIISSTSDYREAARRRLPPFLFHYIDGGANAEVTLRRKGNARRDDVDRRPFDRLDRPR